MQMKENVDLINESFQEGYTRAVHERNATMMAAATNPNSAFDYTKSPEGADPKILALLRAIADVHVNNLFLHFSDIKRGMLDEVFLSANKWAGKNKSYREYIDGMKMLYLYARQGKSVVVKTDGESFDFKMAFDVLKAMRGVIPPKADAMIGEVGMYPLQGFTIRFKSGVVYDLLTKHVPGFMPLIKKNKLTLYVTEDFNLAVESRFWQCEELTDLLRDKRGFDRYKLTPNLTLYVIPQE